MAKLSFVMPTRNRGKLISEAIESIRNQTEQDWELIIVDDHSDSDDKTKEVVDSFDDKRIKYFVLTDENGKGIAAARNFGNQMASAQYVAIADSDDISYPHRLEATLKEFEDKHADVVYGKIHVWDPETDVVENRELRHEAREFNLDKFKEYDFIPNPTVAMKRQLALDFPYNSFFKIAEDYDMLSRIYAYGFKFSFIDDHLAKYRVHKNSIMIKKDFQFKYSLIVPVNRGWKRSYDET